MMKRKKIGLAIFLNSICLSVFAADQVIKEETAPPSAEGAISVDQIQPIESAKFPTTVTPIQPQTIRPSLPTVTSPTAPASSLTPPTTPPAAPTSPPLQQPFQPTTIPTQPLQAP